VLLPVPRNLTSQARKKGFLSPCVTRQAYPEARFGTREAARDYQEAWVIALSYVAR
jgi:hypothetical protein